MTTPPAPERTKKPSNVRYCRREHRTTRLVPPGHGLSEEFWECPIRACDYVENDEGEEQ